MIRKLMCWLGWHEWSEHSYCFAVSKHRAIKVKVCIHCLKIKKTEDLAI